MPTVVDPAQIAQVQQANDIIDVVAEHVSLKKKGREMVGLCPFHEDHRPSLYVNPVKQIFKCFACGAGGDVYKFVQMRENLSFPQAIERLAERAGIALRRSRASLPEKPAQGPAGDPNRLAKANAWAAEIFQRNLWDSDDGKSARAYLKERQISEDSARRWRIGLAANRMDQLVTLARAAGGSAETLQQAGLTVSATQDKFIHRLMFTITDVTGRVIGFGGRTLDGTGAKYINSPTTVLFDKSNTLYGLEQARHQIVATGTAVVVEGYTDVIMAHQCGCENVVATLGTSLTAGHGRMLRRYAKKVVLVFDSDVAGIEAANRALEVCLSQRIDIRLASVPEGKDPCEFLLAAGKDAFERLIENATDVLEFKWDRLQQSIDQDDTLAGQRAAIDDFLQAVATGLAAGRVPAIERGIIVKRLAKVIGLEDRQINTELSKRIDRLQRSSQRRQDRPREPIHWGQGVLAVAQRQVLEVLLAQPQLYANVAGRLAVEVFSVPILREVAEVLLPLLDRERQPSLAQVLAGAESVRLAEAIVEMATEGERRGNYESTLAEALGALQLDGSGLRPKRSGVVRQNPRTFGPDAEHVGIDGRTIQTPTKPTP